MIKTIDTENITQEMCGPIGFYNAHSIGWVKAILEAAPEVKAEPVAFGLPNPSITDKNKLMMVAIDIPSDDQYGGALWQPLYLHPPAASDVVERIRALLKVIPEYASVNGHQLIYDIIRRIEGAK